MAISKNMIFTTKEKKKFSSKKDIEVPVDPCQGWVTPCKYCDKRFGKWLDVSEETLAKIPTRPGIFVLALYYKNCTEVVDITINTNDIQRLAYTKIDHAKDYIIDKKTNTSSKSTILCRWMAFKETNDKDVIKLCAHWYNNGVLPKFLKSWPGLDILQNAESLRFSHYLHKWCYIKIESIWRHSKPLPTKTAEVIKGCNWTQPCEICDSYFGEWKKVTNVVAKSLAPEKSGIYMLSVCYSTTREVVKICYGKKITLNIKGSFEKHYKAMDYILKSERFAYKKAHLEVRWMQMKDPETENCCFLYAHWQNADSPPMINHPPGGNVIGKYKQFVIRDFDNKWCYETEGFKFMKKTKSRQRKHALNDLEDDFYFDCYE